MPPPEAPQTEEERAKKLQDSACIELLLVVSQLPDLKLRIRRLLSAAVGEDGEAEVGRNTITTLMGMVHEASQIKPPGNWTKTPLEYTRAVMPNLCTKTRDLQDAGALEVIVKRGVVAVIEQQRLLVREQIRARALKEAQGRAGWRNDSPS